MSAGTRVMIALAVFSWTVAITHGVLYAATDEALTLAACLWCSAGAMATTYFAVRLVRLDREP